MKLTLLTLLTLLVPSLVPATTVETVTFEALVKGADRIFRGEVVAIESFRADLRGNRRIRTRVAFAVDDTLKGRGVSVVLEFLGGTVGDLTQDVMGMPRFAVGESYVVFARDGDRWVNPIVGFTQGLFRVSRDARDGTLRVLTAGGAPVSTVAAIGHAQSRVAATLRIPISVAAFVDEIRAEIARPAR